MTKCSYMITTSGGRVSWCPSEANHSCGKCESHCTCQTCKHTECTIPRDCRGCMRCYLHCNCGDSERVGTKEASKAVGPFAGCPIPDLESGLPHSSGGSYSEECSTVPSRTDAPSDWSSSSASSEWAEDWCPPDEDHYCYREHLGKCTLSREYICRAWDASTHQLSNRRGCPVPLDVMDLSFTTPVARQDQNPIPGAFEFRRDTLYVHFLGLCREVRRCSDLMLSPWSTRIRKGWPHAAANARGLMAEFYALVDIGTIDLTSTSNSSGSRDSVCVEFDHPMPSLGRKTLGRYRSRPFNLSAAWRFSAKSMRCLDGPPWLLSEAFTPDWWPSDHDCGSRWTVPAFVDGTVVTRHRPMGCGSEDVVLLGQLPNGVRIFGYVADVYDKVNAGIWFDEAALVCDPLIERSRVYVISSDGRSAYVDRVQREKLELLGGAATVTIDTEVHGPYPTFELCRTVATALERPKFNTYSKLGYACRTGAPEVVRTLALSPFILKFKREGNCLFDAFRGIGEPGLLSLGPVNEQVIRQSGLLAAHPSFVVTALSGKPLKAEGGHIQVGKSITDATAMHKLEGSFGYVAPTEAPRCP